MSNEFLLGIAALLAIAAYIQAYNWGWHAGHDVHHDEQVHGPNVLHQHDEEDDKPTGPWV